MGLVAGNMMSETNEWYTPEQYIASVRAVLGCIDLDPASCETANAVVQAAEIFTEADNGLRRAWHGRVFLNPPYGKDGTESRAGQFCRKAITEYQAGRVRRRSSSSTPYIRRNGSDRSTTSRSASSTTALSSVTSTAR